MIRALWGLVDGWLASIERALVTLTHEACPCGDHDGDAR